MQWLNYVTTQCPFRQTRVYQLTNALREVLRSLRVPGIPRLPAMHI